MVSVIVPVYKVEAYLGACIASVLAQSCPDFELILVNDGSPDKCGEICRGYAARDSRIRVIEQQNAGLSAARNAGIAASKGEYITFIDGDDIVHPHYLRTLLEAVRQTGADIALCRHQKIQDGGAEDFLKGREESDFSRENRRKNNAKSSAPRKMSGREAAEHMLKYNDIDFISAWGKLYPRTMLPKLIYPSGKWHEDLFVTYRVFYETDAVAVCECAYYGYVQRSGSITAVFSQKRLDSLEAFAEQIRYFEDLHEEKLAALAQRNLLMTLQRFYCFCRRDLDNPELEEGLYSRYQETFRQYRETVPFRLWERIAAAVFRTAPKCYAMAYIRIYDKIFG